MALSSSALLLAVFSLLSLACLGVVWRLRRKVFQLATDVSKRDSTLSKLSAELEAQALLARQMSMDLEELRQRLTDKEEAAAPSPVWPSLQVPVNLNRRGQILRLSRKGKSVAEIAQDLSVARGEVELLLKVHDLSQKDPVR